METFTVRDLREHTGELIHDAEKGKLSLITKHGRPVFLAVPFDDLIFEKGLQSAIAIQLYKEGTLSLEKAAKMANLVRGRFIDLLGNLGISVARYAAEE